ncbi:MAG: SMI1/KNR4 family protein, partial [Verrucomicrobia bacterium]|nr:SMI1/KNR4 family protein [Verrucomicrobiota bacterium]
ATSYAPTLGAIISGTMKTEIKTFIDNLNSDFDIVKKQVDRYYHFDNKANLRHDGAVKVFNRTWVAPMNYGLLLFPPADKTIIDKFEKKEKLKIPDLYRVILTIMNGCFIYDFSLFGLPKSIYEKGLLDRSDLYQFDLGTANKFWALDYDIEPNLFHFGGRAYSFDENTGYFIDQENKIYSILPSGQIIKTWTSFKQFMTDEVLEAEKMMREDLPKELSKK